MNKELARRKGLRASMTKKINEFNSCVNEGASKKEVKVISEKIEQIWLKLSEIS